jgi:hypothetical protein
VFPSINKLSREIIERSNEKMEAVNDEAEEGIEGLEG